jgi:LmbE family N-acetylglucosaminyl deacetylase
VVIPALGRVLAVSPHLDDAVLSAGALISAHPGSTVLTVFAGVPLSYDGLTEWDAESGFAEGDNIVALRREEDRRATACLGAQCQWLDFLDGQYTKARPTVDDVAKVIGECADLLQPDTIALPLGRGHGDHECTHEACALLLEHKFDMVEHWVAWADIPYRIRHPEMYAGRLNSLRSKGFLLTPFEVKPNDAKRAAIAEYPSQARALGSLNMSDTEQPEQFYLVTRQ